MEQSPEALTRAAEIEQNWEVYGADGQLVGHVNEVHANYVWVQKGLLFPQDMYIPTTACARIEPGRVDLNVTTQEVIAAGWHCLPEVISAGGSVVLPQTEAGRAL